MDELDDITRFSNEIQDFMNTFSLSNGEKFRIIMVIMSALVHDDGVSRAEAKRFYMGMLTRVIDEYYDYFGDKGGKDAS